MKIIILASGKGERLWPLTKNTPKALIDMGNGNTLLEEQIERIMEAGVIDEIVLVVGYLADQIEAKIKHLIEKGINIRTVYNPFYEYSNNLITLWLAKYEFGSDFIVTNGDNLFSSDVYKEFVLAMQKDGIFVSMSKKASYCDDDMKINLADEQRIARISKEIDSAEIDGESPGLVLVKGEKSRKIFAESLEDLARNKKFLNSYWLEVFNYMYEKGIPVNPWFFDAENRWQEVDFHVDLEKMKELIHITVKKD